MASVRVYSVVARHSFRRYSTYRLATAAGAFTNTIFGFIRASVLIALFSARPHIGGYDLTDAVTFCFLSQALLAPMAIFGPPLELAERIRTGDIAIDLYRPVDLQAWWLASDLGRAGYQLLARGLPPFVVGALAFRLRLPTSPGQWLAAVGSVLLGLLVGFALRYLMALSTFWLLDDRGVNAVSFAVATFFSGLLLPLVLFPGWLGTLARATPWAATMAAPSDVFLGKYPGPHLLHLYAFQVAWAVGLLAVGRLLTGVARRRVVVQGG